MNEQSKQFFQTLIETPCPSGYEERIQKKVRDYMSDVADQITTDVHGNVFAVRNPGAKIRVMLAGHCDQIGLMVNYIDSDGFVYVSSIGGWDPQVLIGVRVTIWGTQGPVLGVIGKKPIHLLTDDERKKVPKVSDLWVDIGASSKEDAENVVQVGDAVTVDLAYQELLNGCVAAPATDDKAGLWVIMEALRRIDAAKLDVAVYAVSTVQEEVGLRGAVTSSFGIDPQVGIAVDVTHATDCPTIDKKVSGEIKLGAGPAIGKGPNMNMKLVQSLINVAKTNEIPFQMAAENRITGTDANSIQRSRSGVATGLVSIPNRYMHTPVEVVSWKDMDGAATLIARFCESISDQTDFIPGLD